MSEDRYNADDIGTGMSASPTTSQLDVADRIAVQPRSEPLPARGDIPGLQIIDESPYMPTQAEGQLDEVLDAPLGATNIDEAELKDLVREAERGEIDHGAETPEVLGGDIDHVGDDDDVDESAPYEDDLPDATDGTDDAEAALADGVDD